MTKNILLLIAGILLIVSNLYAGNGDLIVNGNIGAGTTSPAYKLDVSGDIRFTGTLQGGSVPWARMTTFPAACSSGQYVSGIGSTLTCSTPSGGGGGLSGSGTANYVSKWTAGTTLGNSLIYDNGTNVGIGTTSPTTKLQLTNGELGIGQGSSAPIGRLGLDSGTALYLANNAGMTGSGMYYITNAPISAIVQYKTSGDIYFLTGSSGTGPVIWSAKLYITNSGNVGIGTPNPTYQLHLSTDSAAKPSTSTWSCYSDARLKTDIQPYTKGLKEILRINPVNYKYNGKGGVGHNKIMGKDPVTGQDVETDVLDTELLSKTNVGVVAQDIQVVVPETVSSHKGKINEDDKEETDILDFNPHSLIFILINAVKELSARIDSLNQQIADLKAQVK